MTNDREFGYTASFNGTPPENISAILGIASLLVGAGLLFIKDQF